MADLATLFEEKAGGEAIMAAVIGLPGYSIKLGAVPAGKVLSWDVIRPHIGGAAGLPIYAWTPTRVLWSRGGSVDALPRNPTDMPEVENG